MWYVRASWIVILVGFAGVAKAVDLDLSMTTTVGYDDNVFRTDKDTKDDASFRFGPTIRVRDETSDLSYNVSYNPVYEKFVTWTDADDLSHFVHGALEYQLSDQTLLSLSENFRFAQSLNRGPLIANEDASGTDIEPVPETEVQRKDVYWNTASASVIHNFSAHTQGEFTLSQAYFDSERANTSKNNTVSGFANVMHSLSARDQLGLGGGVTWQRFDGVRGQPQSDTFIFRLAGSWIHNFGQDTELIVRAGPAVIYTDQQNDRTTSEALYPFKLVAGTPTIGQAYAALGLELPADVQDLNGTPLLASESLGAGSVLIPGDTNCQDTAFVSGQPVFDQSNCSFNVVVNADPVNLAFEAAANTISGAPSVNLNFVSGNGGVSDTEVTVFGEASISHHWFPELSSRASYVRSDSGATSLGSSAISDRAMVDTVWTPTRRWDLSVRGDWLQRKSATDTSNTFVVIAPTSFGFVNPVVTSTALVTGKANSAVDTEYWRVSGRAAYRTSRRSTVSLRVGYQHQDTDRGSTRTNSTFENVTVMLGFRYDLDPFHF
ncbi:MAG: hypothetical protein IH827_05540 [Myxococcales bacterium]|nr:hypothetical protein [Myxococcales bacterium]